MPYVQRTQRPSRETEKLVGRLAEELQSPREFGQPVILEDRTPDTRSIQVHVVWDDWEDCPRESRDGIIRDAYNRLGKLSEDEQITLAIGLTVPEAAAIGLLPIQVVSVPGSGSVPNREEFRQAAMRLGGSVLRNAAEPELRCANLEQAEAIMEQLREEFPGSKWIIAREVHVGDDY